MVYICLLADAGVGEVNKNLMEELIWTIKQ